MTRLSNSAVNKYLDCPKSYYYHYKKGYRSKFQSAALSFGTAIDKATEKYALTRNKSETFATFDKYWKTQEINGTYTDLQLCTEIVYGNNDLDIELLSESNHKLIAETHGVKDVLATIDSVCQTKDKIGYKNLTTNDKKIFNQANWLCTERKGYLMLEAFIKWFDNNILEVLTTQGKIDLVDGESPDDSILGYTDLVVRLKGYEKPVVLDIKTSARAYEPDSVKKSVQLSLYVFALKHMYEDTNTAGYVVLHKQILKNKTKVCKTCGFDGTGGSHKTCPNETLQTVEMKKGPVEKMVRCGGDWNVNIDPEAIIQIVIDEVSETMQETVVENYGEVARGIKAEIFPRNFASCSKYNGAVICPFVGICTSNCMDDVFEKDKE